MNTKERKIAPLLIGAFVCLIAGLMAALSLASGFMDRNVWELIMGVFFVAVIFATVHFVRQRLKEIDRENERGDDWDEY